MMKTMKVEQQHITQHSGFKRAIVSVGQRNRRVSRVSYPQNKKLFIYSLLHSFYIYIILFFFSISHMD